MSTRFTNIIILIILLISIFLWIYRIFPYFFNNLPLGYDPWLYKLLFLDYTNNLPNINFVNLTDWTKESYPPFLWFLWNILHIIWFKIDFLLSFWLWFFSIITTIFIYLNLKKYSKIAAIIWVIIFLISIIQYQSFWWNYYKQIIWIIFILSTFSLLEKKKYILSLPMIISLFTIHRPSGVFFLITYIIYKLLNFIFNKDDNWINTGKKELWIIISAWIIAIWIYIPVFQEQIINLIKPLLTTVLTEGKSWTFFSKSDFWNYNVFIILASIYWLYIKLQKKEFDIITSWYIAWMIWVWFWLFFYNRFYIFFDIFIILMAAYSFWVLYNKNKKYFSIIFITFFIFQSLFYFYYVKSHNRPLVSNIEFENIKKINKIVPENSMIMVTHKNYSPWIAWYTYKPTIAPWLFKKNLWDLETWKIWWSSDWEKKCEMINDYKIYNKPLYLWVWERQPRENLENWDCFEETQIKWNWFNLFKINFK